MAFAAPCFICDRYVNGHGISLRLGHTTYSKTELPLKIGQLIGDNFMVVVSKDDELCASCFNLIDIADKLEEELFLVKKEISQFLESKYQLTVDEITVNNGIREPEPACAVNKSSKNASQIQEKVNITSSIENMTTNELIEEEKTMWNILVLSTLIITVSGVSDKLLESKQIIDIVNNAPTTWKAGHNFGPHLSIKYSSRLLGVKIRESREDLPLDEIHGDSLNKFNSLPGEFDARKKWPFCTALQQLRDQGNCGSCWAVAATATFTDRLCIATNGSFNGHLSTEELMTCCTACGNCEGGLPDKAWQYFKEHGIVTGGDYGSKEGCQPYQKRPCEHGGTKGSRKNCDDFGDVWTPKCRKTCINKKYRTSFKKDHYKVKKAYYLKTVRDMQSNIYKYGPIETAFMVYQDFLSYKSGIYQYVTGDLLGGHAVKIIGWGVENHTDYWLAANSWNSDWGDNGFFKIKRGSDECQFESMQVVAGDI